jgi:hypothetical protein
MAKQESIQWESLQAAALRLDRNTGHLRKLCPTLQREGKARWVVGGGKRSGWEVRTDFTMKPSAVRVPGSAIIIEIGGSRIVIDGPCRVEICSPPAQQPEAIERPPERRSIGN